jgi:hypothetical protein
MRDMIGDMLTPYSSSKYIFSLYEARVADGTGIFICTMFRTVLYYRLGRCNVKNGARHRCRGKVLAIVARQMQITSYPYLLFKFRFYFVCNSFFRY